MDGATKDEQCRKRLPLAVMSGRRATSRVAPRLGERTTGAVHVCGVEYISRATCSAIKTLRTMSSVVKRIVLSQTASRPVDAFFYSNKQALRAILEVVRERLGLGVKMNCGGAGGEAEAEDVDVVGAVKGSA